MLVRKGVEKIPDSAGPVQWRRAVGSELNRLDFAVNLMSAFSQKRT